MSFKVMLGAVGACLALAGCVAADTYYASYPDASLAPSFGSATLSAGQRHFVDIEAGGGFDAATLSPSCRGYIYGAPDYVVHVQATGATALLVAVAGYSGADVTLVVMGPSGELYCSDESDDELDAWLELRNPRSGRYAIWAAAHSPGTHPLTFLGVSLIALATAGPANTAPPRPTTMLN
jgi:hypothetical protein